MAEQAMAETGARRAIAIHDARRDEVYVEIAELFPAAVMPVARARDAILDVAKEGATALSGTAAPRMTEALAPYVREIILSAVRQPDALWVARLAMGAEATDTPPRPLYLRAPDAKLPAAPA
jgi:tRNA A37 threonylcarbamoyladenosine modification protein TsaB